MTDSQDTIRQMIKMIEQEAKEKAESIKEEAKHRLQIEKNKIYKEERDKLIKEYKKREEEDKVRRRTETSRHINESRLRLQEGRMALIKKLEGEVLAHLKSELQQKDKYKKLLKELVVQGLIRLMEEDVKLRCRAEDADALRSVLKEAAAEYAQFLKQETGQDKRVTLELVDKIPLDRHETELGGVMLYCGKNRIVFTNTIDQRFKLCLQESVPDFRNTLFPSLARPPLERRKPEKEHH